MSNARAVALRALIDYQRRDAYLGVLLSSRLSASTLDRRDRALVTELVQGTVRMKLTLDYLLRGFSRRPLEELDDEVLWSLRLSAYQVVFMEIPDYAAVDMGVNATEEVTGRHAVGFVNAVMRAFVAGYRALEYPDPRSDPAGYLEVRYSHPRWVVDMWVEEMGFEKAESICAADNESPPLSIRANLARTTRGDLAAALAGQGLEVEEGMLAAECLLIKKSGYIADLEEFKKGLFAAQDQGSMLVGHNVGPVGGMRVLDMCAAPGGKANHMAELMRNEGTVLAVDLNPARLRMVRESAARLGNSAVELLEADARQITTRMIEGFDRVLVDAPCTGLGTLARRPDTRWRRQQSDLESLVELQAELIEEGGRAVSVGGTLTYSTCTISKRENQGIVETFLESRSGSFEPIAAWAGDSKSMPDLQLYPDTHGCDGMFMAVMRRTA